MAKWSIIYNGACLGTNYRRKEEAMEALLSARDSLIWTQMLLKATAKKRNLTTTWMHIAKDGGILIVTSSPFIARLLRK